MPTDEINAGENVSDDAHSHQDDELNADEAHSDDSKNSFDARRAFDSTNEKVNKLAKTLEEISSKLGPKEDAKDEPVEKGDNDVERLVEQKLWYAKNEDRINKNEEIKSEFESLRKQGTPEPLALELAEARNGVKVGSKEQERQNKVSSASGSVDRSDMSYITSDERKEMSVWGYDEETLKEHKKLQAQRG